ncbi:hypothetical protein [Synechococcus sp. MEDNS5]|uniref:hypothetical protein n=1 Tax=Synechococcus sp. MEDNS5 TaxID=1442554 RepID=UPI002105A6A1|nr:hypothetical protein [Synechococcus sp. MEDNS5]
MAAMTERGDTGTQANDPRWFDLLMASRWPLAVVLAAWAVAIAAVQILKKPIPIGLPLSQPLPVKLVGGVSVEQFKVPVRVKSEGALSVEAIKALPVSGSVKVPEGVALSRPIQVDTSTPLEVNSDVNVDSPIVVSEVSNPVSIRAVDGETLQVSTPDGETLNIIGGVKVNSVGGKINVRLRDAAQSLLPTP